jgi:phosphoglycolate phosphatase
MSSQPRYELLLLDFDGTLASTHEDVIWCMRRTFESFGAEPPAPARVLATIGLLLEKAVESLRPPGHPLPISEWVAAYRRIFHLEAGPRTRFFEGAAAVLGEAKRRGIETAVVSNRGSLSIEVLLRRLGPLRPRCVLGRDRVMFRKPDARLLHRDLHRRFPATRPEAMLVVGDTSTDLRFARAAKLSACWAEYGYGDRAHCLRYRPRYTIRDFSELLRVLADGA